MQRYFAVIDEGRDDGVGGTVILSSTTITGLAEQAAGRIGVFEDQRSEIEEDEPSAFHSYDSINAKIQAGTVTLHDIESLYAEIQGSTIRCIGVAEGKSGFTEIMGELAEKIRKGDMCIWIKEPTELDEDEYFCNITQKLLDKYDDIEFDDILDELNEQLYAF